MNCRSLEPVLQCKSQRRVCGHWGLETKAAEIVLPYSNLFPIISDSVKASVLHKKESLLLKWDFRFTCQNYVKVTGREQSKKPYK